MCVASFPSRPALAPPFLVPFFRFRFLMLIVCLQGKLRALRIVDEELGASLWRTTPDFPRLVSFAVASLVRVLGDEDMQVRPLLCTPLTLARSGRWRKRC